MKYRKLVGRFLLSHTHTQNNNSHWNIHTKKQTIPNRVRCYCANTWLPGPDSCYHLLNIMILKLRELLIWRKGRRRSRKNKLQRSKMLCEIQMRSSISFFSVISGPEQQHCRCDVEFEIECATYSRTIYN